MNKVPADATVTVDIRFIPKDFKSVRQAIKRLAAQHKLTLHFYTNDSHQSIAATNPYLIQLMEATQKITGKKPSLVKQHYGSDMRMYSAVGVPSVCFGPAGAGMHQDVEWVSIDSLNHFRSILQSFLANI